jgi:hypothetical protein
MDSESSHASPSFHLILGLVSMQVKGYQLFEVHTGTNTVLKPAAIAAVFSRYRAITPVLLYYIGTTLLCCVHDLRCCYVKVKKIQLFETALSDSLRHLSL